MTTFSDFGLSAQLLQSVEEEGYVTPTPIQIKAIPPVLAGSDLLGIAQTGTGKTAAFALPILQRLTTERRPAPRKGCRVLVLSPTRELAAQIAESFRTYGRRLGVSVAAVYGGVGHRPQSMALQRGVDVLVATPGRLLDHMGERNLSLASTEIFVLDEADQMLDLGFVKPIRQIVAQMTSKRQNLFFSATMPSEIGKLAAELLHSPVRVTVTPVASTVDKVNQRVIHVESQKKRALLVELLGNAEMSRTLVFTRTKRGADKVAGHLESAGIAVAAIHGNKSQNQREAALNAFRNSKVRVLVATDIAARGIDVDQVSHIVNYELPEVPEAYVHRIGRTARAGASGEAISFCDGAERGMLRDIERLTRQSILSQDRRNDDGLAIDRTAGRAREERGMSRSGREARSERNGFGRTGRARGEGRQGGENRSVGGPGRNSGKRDDRYRSVDADKRAPEPRSGGGRSTDDSRRRESRPGDGNQRPHASREARTGNSGGDGRERGNDRAGADRGKPHASGAAKPNRNSSAEGGQGRPAHRANGGQPRQGAEARGRSDQRSDKPRQDQPRPNGFFKRKRPDRARAG